MKLPVTVRHFAYQREISLRFLFILMVAIGFAATGLGLIATVCWYAVPPLQLDAAFAARFTVENGFFYARQPAKYAAYELDCLAAPFLLAAGYFLGRNLAGRLCEATLLRLLRAGIVLYGLLFLGCLVPLIYCPHPPFWMVPPSWLLLPFYFSHPILTPARVLCLAVGAALGFVFLRRKPSRWNSNLVMLPLVLAWVLLAPTRFYAPVELNDDLRFVYHLNAVLDALSQSVNGRHFMVDFPHIYGGYVEILAPFLRLFPRDLGAPLLVLGLPSALSVLFLLLTARLMIREPAVLFLTGTALLGIEFVSGNDAAYCYTTSRTFFSAAGLWTAMLYLRRPGGWNYGRASFLIAIAPVWNLDTGVVLWMSWVAMLVARECSGLRFRQAARNLILQTMLLAFVWASFFVYLRLMAGRWPDPGLLFYFQEMVMTSGYFCLGMLFPDMWVMVVVLYAIGLGTALVFYLRRASSWKTDATLLLSLYGIGLFSYFTGRSVQTNLIVISYPAILLAGLFLDETRRMIALGRIPEMTRAFLFPWTLILFWWCFLLAAAFPDLLEQSGTVLRDWCDRSVTPLETNAAFVRKWTTPDEPGIYMLSNQSGVYYYLSQTTCPLQIPGTIELLRTRDMDTLISALRAGTIRKLFIEDNFYNIEMYKPSVYREIRDVISQHYRVVAVGETGRIELAAPK